MTEERPGLLPGGAGTTTGGASKAGVGCGNSFPSQRANRKNQAGTMWAGRAARGMPK